MPKLVLALVLLPFLAACSSSRTNASMDDGNRAPKPMSFELTGSRIIGCCCPTPCPCRLNRKPMNCHGCDHTDAVHVEKGRIGDVDVSGIDYVIVGRGFGKEKAGNWTYVYVSDKANDAQMKALGDWLGATVQGWGGKAAYLAGEFVGMRKAPVRYTVSKDGKEYDCSVAGVLELKTHAITNPGHAEPVVSTGIMDAFGDRFVHADCLAHTLNDPTIGRSWDLTGRQCNQATFTFDDERAAKGGIGWGCWSAHSDYGDGEPYGEELVGHDAPVQKTK